MLYGVVRGHWSDFAAEVRDRTADGAALPAFVVGEFRKFLRCGVLAHGFARVRCADCAFERLVAFSCNGRGVCPSCGGRRMAERAAHLVEHVIPPDVPGAAVGALGAPSPAYGSPTAADVRRVVRRVHRCLARLGLVAVPAEDVAVDPFDEESAVWAGLTRRPCWDGRRWAGALDADRCGSA